MSNVVDAPAPQAPPRLKKRCKATDCEDWLPVDAPTQQKYCSIRCRGREVKRRQRTRQRFKDVAASPEQLHRTRIQTGDHYYDEYVNKYAIVVQGGGMTMADVAGLMGTSPSFVSKIHTRWLAEQQVERNAEGWVAPEPYSDDLVEDFVIFRAKHFQTSDGEPYDTPGFQRKWVAAFLRAWAEGGCLLVLSPPRHGKTELYTQLCVWLIIRYPNIRIVYIGGSSEIAEQSVEMAKDYLENSESLLEFVPPGKHFRPQVKSGRTWTRQRFTVATRTVTGIKSPTMVAVGRGGKMPSRDADVVIIDDPEDHDSTIHPGTREDTRGWMAKSVLSRKEEHTCVFCIGSRVHPDDLVGHLGRSPNFEVIIEQAHDPTCTVPADDEQAHWDCMLWPEMRSYRWLIAKKNDPMEGMYFEMVYQNQAVDDELAHFRPDDIDACCDKSRPLGHIPKGVRLIAGLDPSVSGYQAAFLWGIEMATGRRFMVDLNNRLGGGIQPALEIMQAWYEQYRVAHWVVEENLYHGAIIADDKIKNWANRNYVVIEGHETWGTNKWDKHFGVTAMGRLFREEFDDGPERMISLPVGNEEGKLKVREYRTQLINFNRDAQAMNSTRRKRYTSDIVMASWFPETVIRRWHQEEGMVKVNYTQTQYPFAGMDLVASSWG